MKVPFIFSLFITLSISIFSQDCGTFYPFKEGTSFELTSYDKKDKVTGTVSYNVLAVSGSGSDQTASIKYELYDEKGKKVEMAEGVNMDQEYSIHCDGSSTYIDMESIMFSNPAMNAYQNMEVSMEGEDIMVPNQLAVGNALPNSSLRMTATSGPMKINMTITFMNRQVVGEEQLTTPAGTFDTYVIEYDSEMKMGITRTNKGKQWIAKNVGMVKEEFYNKGGKLLSYTQLTTFNP